jgi:hypothetical protein
MNTLKIEVLPRYITLEIARPHVCGRTKDVLITHHSALERYLEVHIDKDAIVPPGF